MKKAAFSLPALMLLAALSHAQVTTEPAPPPANQLASGTVISAELSKSLDAKKLKPNDKVEARSSMDVLSRGQILVPRNAKIVGHVTEAKARSKDSPDSMVGIAFDRILLKDGRELPLQAAVQALGRPLQLGPSVNGTDSAAMDSPASLGQGGVGQRGNMTGASTTTSSQYPSQFPDRRPVSISPDEAAPGSTVSPLGPTSHGVIGMKGFSLADSGQASVVSSSTDNVHLDSGTQLILRVQ